MLVPQVLKFHVYHLIALLMLMLPCLSIQAEEIKLKHDGLTVNANLQMAEGKNYQDGIVLVIHDLLGHNQMEIVETSQQALHGIGRSSLAINLSLSVDNRLGFFDCNVAHRHIQNEALDEIQVWINYLKSQGANKIVLMGHSFGANQIMVYAQNRLDPVITQLIFLAPNTTGVFSEGYNRRYGQSVDTALSQAKQLIMSGKSDQLMENTDFLSCPQAKVTANSFASYYSPDLIERYFNFSQFLSFINIPTFITTGTADERQPDIAKHILPYADGKKIRLSVIEDAGHFFRDFNIEKAMESAIEFLEETQ